VEWHGGFRVTADDLRRNAAYRGPEFAELGICLARDSHLDPAMIGDASRSGRHDEQSLKRVWHYVARFRSPEMRAAHDRGRRPAPQAEQRPMSPGRRRPSRSRPNYPLGRGKSCRIARQGH
jgi:hypothetical protein